MTGRTAIALFVGVALLGARPLCVAGWVTHDCACAPEHGGEHERDGDHDSGCRHERDCAEDPCDRLAMHREPDGDNADVLAPSAGSLIGAAADDFPRFPQTARDEDHSSFGFRKLPFPVSDVPQRI